MRKDLAILIGLPGSGKSTYINSTLIHQGYQIVCRDDIRKILPDYKNHELFVSAVSRTMCAAFMERNLSIAIDETNTHLYQIEKWIKLANEYDYNTVGILINTDLQVCIDRRIKTDFPIDVIENMFVDLNKLKDEVDLEELFDKFYII